MQVVILSLIADGSCTLNKTETVTIARMDIDNDTLQLELIERQECLIEGVQIDRIIAARSRNA